ncbi:MAG: neutral/alkaline non-lysosomal ceramidase N-terminal domain-containing protein [Bryobacterales bacterium]|nr:neutral/alkaline non-lysosomal ceramidase N-terminal domain-containing protein [Bryobacterales bacterium]
MRLAFTLVALSAVFPVPIALAQDAWKAGVAKAAITPNEPAWMAGFSSRTHKSEGVRHDLWAKALALRDGGGNTAVLVTLDLCDISRDMAAIVAKGVEQKYGLKRDQFALNVSHTHSGPIVTLNEISGWYDVPAADQEEIRAYTRWMLGQIVDVIGGALKDLQPATLSFEQGVAGIATNRRRTRLRNLPGPVDQDVPVLAVRGQDGKLRAIVAGYACHATALSDYQINGDWPGFAQIAIERANPGATAMFVQGAGADANALPRRSVQMAEEYGGVLAEAVAQVLKGEMKPVTGSLKTVYEEVMVPFHNVPDKQELQARIAKGNAYQKKQYTRLMRILEEKGKLPVEYPYPVQIWRLGDVMKMVILGGELVADYSLRLKQQHGWFDTWVVGYSNDVFAYIPSRRVLREGGYEGTEAMLGDGHPAPFGAAVEEIIVEEVEDLLKKSGN